VPLRNYSLTHWAQKKRLCVRDSVWGGGSCGPREPCILWASPSSKEKGQFWGTCAHWNALEKGNYWIRLLLSTHASRRRWSGLLSNYCDLVRLVLICYSAFGQSKLGISDGVCGINYRCTLYLSLGATAQRDRPIAQIGRSRVTYTLPNNKLCVPESVHGMDRKSKFPTS